MGVNGIKSITKAPTKSNTPTVVSKVVKINEPSAVLGILGIAAVSALVLKSK